MNYFDFSSQLGQSYPGVELLARWLRMLPQVKDVQIIQDNPDYFHVGDISFKTETLVTKYIEVKTETRTSHETPNLAIERYSDTSRKTDGGPWATSADYYVHIYADKVMSFMQTSEVRRWLEPQLKGFRWFEAKNISYVTSGILVPRSVARQNLKSYREIDLTGKGS